MSWKKAIYLGLLTAAVSAPVMPLSIAYAQDNPSFNTGQSSPDELTDRQQRLIRNFTKILKSPGDQDIRVFAATSLIDMDLPLVNQQLAQLLADNKDKALQMAIVRAMQGDLKGNPPESLVDPLVRLILSKDPELRKEVHSTISNYPEKAVVLSLSDLAYDEKSTQDMQKTAIMLLGRLSIIHHRRMATETLLNMLRDGKTRKYDQIIYDALENIHNIKEARDPGAWQRWWEANRNKDDRQIMREEITNITRTITNLRTENQTIRKELLQLYEKLFFATPKADRQTQLIGMLQNPRHEIQLLGLRLVITLRNDGESIAEPTLKQVEKLLSDTNVDVRIASAQTIRVLAGAEGLKLLEKRLTEEQVPSVIDAYLTALSSQPKNETIKFAMDRFKKGGDSQALIRFLIAARIADQLTQVQRDELYKASLSKITQNAASPAYAELFTSIAPNSNDTDKNLSVLLSNQDKEVRVQSARGAFLNNRLPLEWAAKYLNDPDLRNIALEAYSRRADTTAHLKALIAHPPADKNNNPRWLGTMQAVANKLSTLELLNLDQELSTSEDPVMKTIDLMLVEIMESRLVSDTPDARRVELAERIPNRLYELGKLNAARNLIMSRLLPKNGLPKELKTELLFLCVSIDLQTGKYDALDNSVKPLLQDKNEQNINQLFQRMMTQVDALRKAKEDQSADQLLSKAEALLSPHLSEDQKQQLVNRKTQTGPSASNS